MLASMHSVRAMPVNKMCRIKIIERQQLGSGSKHAAVAVNKLAL